ncbi:MAG: transcriptional regulator, NifA subfamily, Fis Family [Polyangiaceae bacterium]|jgi:Nif-specific regulatory protein|nr:transcriptional regulator, NifA subfamily, Fis Family [Polyangiaceae bacterium]
MSRIRIEVLSGEDAGRVFESDADVVRVGRAPDCDLRLAGAELSSRHVRISAGRGGFVVEDDGSASGSCLIRGEQRTELRLSDEQHALASGDELELGGDADEPTRLRVTLGDEPPPPEVVATRSLHELQSAPLDAKVWNAVLAALGAAESLEAVVAEVAEAALRLAPRATHATVALLEDSQSLVPMGTRVRGPDGVPVAPEGPVALTRSVARRVVEGRAAVLAADAPREALGSESLLGANIRSTIGVPLWKGDDILGVLQVDNRDAPAMFDRRDVEALGVLARGASLAVVSARLIQKLTVAEEQLRKENQFLRGRERSRAGEKRIVGESRRLEQVLAQLGKVVDTRVTVLIEGETGTGKELFASAIHYRSQRRDKLFVAQNCAAFPENLLESELFGHKRGAFTGATDEKKGLFEVADGGTLFLDEVGEMPLALQAKLLRVLQEGEVRPIGAAMARRVNVRIVAATNRNLEREVTEGRFREDLYYRLKVFPLRVPPLRERREDVPVLAKHFLERYTREFGRELHGFTPPALEILSAYDWPGNVRELENEVQRAVIQAEGERFVTPELLSARVRKNEGKSVPPIAASAPPPEEEADDGSGTLREMMDRVERRILVRTLQSHGNNKTAAAKALGITREGLHKKLKSLGL